MQEEDRNRNRRIGGQLRQILERYITCIEEERLRLGTNLARARSRRRKVYAEKKKEEPKEEVKTEKETEEKRYKEEDDGDLKNHSSTSRMSRIESRELRDGSLLAC